MARATVARNARPEASIPAFFPSRLTTCDITWAGTTSNQPHDLCQDALTIRNRPRLRIATTTADGARNQGGAAVLIHRAHEHAVFCVSERVCLRT